MCFLNSLSIPAVYSPSSLIKLDPLFVASQLVIAGAIMMSQREDYDSAREEKAGFAAALKNTASEFVWCQLEKKRGKHYRGRAVSKQNVHFHRHQAGL